ncbi:MAG: inositol monophosphatase family protein [Ilumatobacteraceae bacterium]
MTTFEGELRDLAVDLARRAGALIREGRRTGTGVVDLKSTATDMVTEYDRASEQLIVTALRTARPDDAIIGEEGTADLGTSGIRWLIDPIDGTTNFFYGLPGYAVSIAAADDDGTIAGAVFVPATDEMFAAARGEGATLDGAVIHCSTNHDLSRALVATGFSYHAERRRRQMERLPHVIAEISDIRRLGAAAPDLCYVAAGRFDAYFEEFLAPWDLAAGELIAREAGCISGDLGGGPVRAEQVLVANPFLFVPLRDLIGRADALAAAARGQAH